MSGLTPMAWRLEEDRRELDAPPVTVACERCGQMYRLHEDDAPDEERVCLRCARAAAARKNARRCANTGGREHGPGRAEP